MAFGHQQSGPRKLAVSTALGCSAELLHLLSNHRSNAPRQHRVAVGTPRQCAPVRFEPATGSVVERRSRCPMLIALGRRLIMATRTARFAGSRSAA